MTLKDQLVREEGWEPKPYRDPRGIWTVGVGHNLEAKPLSDAAIRQILADDIADACAAVDRLGDWTKRLGEARYAVLAHLAFWAGESGMRGFVKMLAACERGDWADAAQELVLSKLPYPRANRLAQQMREGRWTA